MGYHRYKNEGSVFGESSDIEGSLFLACGRPKYSFAWVPYKHSVTGIVTFYALLLQTLGVGVNLNQYVLLAVCFPLQLSISPLLFYLFIWVFFVVFMISPELPSHFFFTFLVHWASFFLFFSSESISLLPVI